MANRNLDFAMLVSLEATAAVQEATALDRSLDKIKASGAGASTGLKATEALFHTGWFVESLATQTLVLFVIRTRGNPLRSRPSTPLAVTVIAVAVLGLALPAMPFAQRIGFTPLPIAFYGFLAVATLTYLGLVEAAKRIVDLTGRKCAA